MNNKNMKKIYNILMAAAIALGTFTSCEDVPMPFNNPLDYLKPDPEEEVIDPVGDGTKDSPFNVAAVLKYINTLEADVKSDKDVYITGVVTSVKEQFGTQYGNATFNISDNDEGSNTFTCYQVYYFNNARYTKENESNNDININEGDVVVVCGRVINFRGGTPETQGREAYVVSINGKTIEPKGEGEAKGAGTQADPYNVAGVLNYLNGLGADVTSPNEVYIKGKVKEITEQFGTQYGNATFTMIDEGFDAVFTAYRVLYLGNKKYTEGDLLKENDEVIVCGKVVNFKGNTPETSQNTGYLYSLNGKTADGGGSSSEVKTVTIADFNAAPVSDTWYQLTGTVKNLKDGDQYGNFDLEDATGSVYVYGLLSEKGGDKKKFQELVAAKGIKEGSKITIIGNRGEYNDKIEVLNAYFVSIEDGGSADTGVKTVSIADFNAAAVSNDVWYKLTGTVKNLKDGDQYGNFDLEDATGSVYVYGLLSEKGGEKKKFQDLVATKGIKEGCKLTIIGNRGEYNGKIEVLNAYFVSIEGGGDTGEGGGGSSDSGATYTMESLGLENAAELGTQTFSDGLSITFAAEENENAPKYYTSGKAARVYAKNSLTIKSPSKNMTKVVLTCVANYLGNEQLYCEADSKKVTVKREDVTLAFSDFSSKTLKIVNDYTEAKSGTQLRIVSIEVTYAK
jgi:RPA family protein